MTLTPHYLNSHYATLHAGHGPGPALGYLAGFDERNVRGDLTGRRLWRVRLKDGTGTDKKDFESAEAALASVGRMAK